MSSDFTGRRFVEADFSGAEFRECDLSGARFVGAVLVDVEIDAYVKRLRVNGVEVMPLVEAELDRLHPERLALRPTTPAEATAALDVVEAFWAPTIQRAARAPAGTVHERVDGEWSLVETLRHLIHAHDLWFRKAILGVDDPHPWGVPAGTPSEPGDLLDLSAVVDVLTARRRDLRDHVAMVDTLDASVRESVVVLLSDEWAHHRFAERDLGRLLDPPPQA